ncbi:suppressor of Mek1-like [Leptopilina boulardi]|uniref:suppressor of Mek1-like n=1 Tax=Leptopilina boulardi TaxID=63433 RepID=UPI0021F52B1A|nr:suppressor of Mek1-like [Leptopilina boulardi]
MRLLFRRPDGCEMHFHLAKLSDFDMKKFTNLIVVNGGKIIENAAPNVLTFTNPVPNSNYGYVFDVKFIEDCIKYRTILDVDKYYVGDSRFYRGCPMSKSIMQSKSCLLNQLALYPSNEEIFITTYEQICIEDSQLMEMEETNISPSTSLVTKNQLSKKTIRNNENDMNTNLEINQDESKILRNIDENLIENSETSERENNKDDILNKNLETSQLENESIRNNEEDLNENLETNQSKNETMRNSKDNLNEIVDTNHIENETKMNVENDRSENFEAIPMENDESLEMENRENKRIDNNEQNAKDNSLTNPKESDSLTSSDSSINQENHDNKIKFIKKKPILTKTKLDHIFNVPDLKNFIENLTKDMRKDADGYPKTNTRAFSNSETRNLISIIIKTNAYQYINSDVYWKYVIKLKLVDRSRGYTSVRHHMSISILQNIEKFQLSDEIKNKFINIREQLKKESELRQQYSKKKK